MAERTMHLAEAQSDQPSLRCTQLKFGIGDALQVAVLIFNIFCVCTKGFRNPPTLLATNQVVKNSRLCGYFVIL